MRSEIFDGFDQINFTLQLKLFRLCAAKFLVDSTKSILRCNWNRFAQAQRKIPYLTWYFVERAQLKVRWTWPKKIRLRLEISSKECSEQFAGLETKNRNWKKFWFPKNIKTLNSFKIIISNQTFYKIKIIFKKFLEKNKVEFWLEKNPKTQVLPTLFFMKKMKNWALICIVPPKIT